MKRKFYILAQKTSGYRNEDRAKTMTRKRLPTV